MFTIDHDEQRNFVRVTGTGSWNPVQLAQFVLESRRIELRLIGRRDVRILGDARRMGVQQETVALFCRGIATRLLAKPGLRIALIAESMLLRLQLERTYDGLPVGIFSSHHEAMAYLDAPEVPKDAVA